LEEDKSPIKPIQLKKIKLSSSSKKSKSGQSSAPNSKTRLVAVDNEEIGPSEPTVYDVDLTRSATIAEKLRNHPLSAPFLVPVDVNLYPNYLAIVRTPMDLSSIRRKIEKKQYRNNEEVFAQIRLVFENCYSYNQDDSPISIQARKLEDYFNSLLHDINAPINDVIKEVHVDYGGLSEFDFKRATAMLTQLSSQPLSFFFMAPVDPIRDGGKLSMVVDSSSSV
jgi:hypothetical protein